MKKDRLTTRITALIQASGKSQAQIAEEIGYPKGNIIAMFKMGVTKVPLNKVGPLAKALDTDPADLVRLALATYYPDTYETVKKHLGELVSKNEVEILRTIREAACDGDPKMGSDQMDALISLFAA